MLTLYVFYVIMITITKGAYAQASSQGRNFIMEKAIKSVLFAIGVALLIILLIIVLGTQTDLDIYSSSRVQNCTILFILFAATSSAVEVFQTIGSLDPIVDFIVDFAIAIATTKYYFERGIFLFDGLTQLFPLLRYLAIPIILVITFSFINFTSAAEKIKR